MKKITTLLTGLLLLTIILQAQKKQSRFLAEVAIGPSFPIGRFADKTYNDKNEIPGFAKPGFATHLSVGYYLNQHIGVLLSTGLSSHQQDKDAFRKEIETRNTGITLTRMDFKSWKSVKLMGGGFVVTPLTSEGKLVLHTRLTAGVSQIDIPKSDFWGSNQSGTTNITSISNEGTLPWSFCYQVSLSLGYKLNNSLYVLLDVNSFNTTAKKEFNYTIYYPGPPPSPGPVITVKNKYKQATVNALLGIGVRF